MTEQSTRVYHATRKAADMDLAKRNISPDSHRAILAGELSLEEARSLGRNAGPGGPAIRVNKDDRTPNNTSCLCGCGVMVQRTFKAGHDQRLVTYTKQYVRGERELTPEQLRYVTDSGKLERAKVRVEREEVHAAKRREKEAKKAEK